MEAFNYRFTTLDLWLKVFGFGLSCSNTWHSVGHHLKCNIDQHRHVENLIFSILFRFFWCKSSTFLLVHSCRARAQLFRAVSNTFWFQKLTKILSLAWSPPHKTQLYAYNHHLHNMHLLQWRCKCVMIYKQVPIMSECSEHFWYIF